MVGFSDTGLVFTGTYPKEEKLIDIGFCNRGFSQDLDSFLLDGFGFGFGSFRFSGYLDIYINQLLIQS